MGRQACRAATEAGRGQLTRHGRAVWRHRRTAIGTVWSVCLVGWTGSLLLPDGGILPAAPAGAAPAAVASAAAHEEGPWQAALASVAAGTERPAPAAGRARQPHEHRAAMVRLQADLDAALALRTAQARQLATIPRLLDGGRNPIHRRRAIQLDQQDALIVSLRLRLAALAPPAADLERRPHGASGQTGGRPVTSAAHAGGAPPAAAAPPVAASAPAGPARTAAPVPPRVAVLCAVLLLAAAAGGARAAWHGQRDGIIDHPSQLQRRLPVLCAIDLPASPGQARRARASRRRAALAGLGLLGLFAALVAAEATGALAALRQGLVAGWPG